MDGKNSIPSEDKPSFTPDIPELKAKENQASSTPGSGGSDKKPLSAGALSSAESAKKPNYKAAQEGGLYNPVEKLSISKRLNFVKNKRSRNAAAGVGIFAAFAGILLAGFLALIPLKLEHIVKNLENRFYATSENAVSKETDNIMAGYIKKYLGPVLAQGKCMGYVSKDCNINIGASTNPVTKLYKSWSQAKIENTLADKYGIELRFDKTSKKFYLKSPGINGESVVGDEKSGIGSAFDQANRGEVRNAFRNAEEGMTLWDKTMFRYKVGTLLKEKYGIKRCLMFCGTRDALSDRKDAVFGGISERKAAAQIYLVQRVLMPLDEARGIALTCVLSSECDPTKTQPSTIDSTNGDLNGTPENPDSDKAIRDKMTELAGAYGGSVDDAITEYGKMKEKGLGKYLVEAAFEKAGLGKIKQQAGDLLPVVGWINKASELVSFLQSIQKAGPTLKKLSYLGGAAASVKLFTTLQTYSQEMHTGHINADEAGSMISLLGPGDHGTAQDPQVGGTSDATATPFYQNTINGNSGSSSVSTSFLSSFMPSQASADSTSNNYLNSCKTKPAKGDQVCPEEKLGGGNDTVNSISDFTKQGVVGQVINVAGAVNSTAIKPILNLSSGAMGAIISATGLGSILSDVSSIVSNLVSPFFTSFLNDVLPNPYSLHMSGGRVVDLAGAGADASGNDFAHIGLGGKRLTPQQAADITNEQENQAVQKFSKQPFFARMFDTNSQYSLITKLALAMPISLDSSARSTLTSYISNPFSVLTHGFASMFSSKAGAATNAQPDPFNIVQYGYPASDIPTDPEAYWNQNCSDGVTGQATQNWNTAASTNLDPNTEMPVNDSTNPCLLINSTVGSDGAIFDTSLLTPDEQAGLNGGNPVSGTVSLNGNCNGGGKYAAIVGPGSSFAGVDQGVDFVPTSTTAFNICAPAPGTITQADQTGHQFQRTTGQAEVIEKLDSPTNVPNSTQYIYFAEIIQLNSSIQVGTHVKAGDVIGQSNKSPGIEVGWAENATFGFSCPISYPTSCGVSFNNWIQNVSAGKGP